MLTQQFADAVVEAEKIIAGAPHVQTEQDLLEGYEYLAGSVQASVRMAWAYERDFPVFAQSTGPHTKMGLDNPDTLYLHAYLRDDAEYVVTGRRGSTADLSFQVLAGDYTPVASPDSLAVFDDRAFGIGDDGRFELRFGPDPGPHPAPGSGSGPAGPEAAGRAGPGRFTLARGSAMLVVREVYSDWSAEQRGTIRIQRADRIGAAPPPTPKDALTKRYGVAGKLLVNRLRTFLAFPEWHYLTLPVNTMTEPRSTPGGLATQFSSVGHYDLDDDQVMILTAPALPKDEAPYHGFQLGSLWYVSLDYTNHQTSLTADQARIDPDGKIRYVVSERDPGLANWVERTGHRRGYLQMRWQRLARDLKPEDGPTVEVVGFDELPSTLPYYEDARVAPQQWAERIAARQAAVADRMTG